MDNYYEYTLGVTCMIDTQIIRQFGRTQDLIRESFLVNTTSFFQETWVTAQQNEMPNIQKYEITNAGEDELATRIHIIRQIPDLFRIVPLIAITSRAGTGRPYSAGFPEMMESKIGLLTSDLTPPFTLSEEDNILLGIGGKEYEIVFPAGIFGDFSSISISDLDGALSTLFPRIKVREPQTGVLALQDIYGKEIVLISGSALYGLGFAPGQTSDTTSDVKGYAEMEDVSVFIDVCSSDRNERDEIMDIIQTLYNFYVFDQNVGNWVTDFGQILFKDRPSRNGENEIAVDGAPFSKVYTDGITIPITVISYLNRRFSEADTGTTVEGHIEVSGEGNFDI